MQIIKYDYLTSVKNAITHRESTPTPPPLEVRPGSLAAGDGFLPEALVFKLFKVYRLVLVRQYMYVQYGSITSDKLWFKLLTMWTHARARTPPLVCYAILLWCSLPWCWILWESLDPIYIYIISLCFLGKILLKKIRKLTRNTNNR